jgi:hypothetical protein
LTAARWAEQTVCQLVQIAAEPMAYCSEQPMALKKVWRMENRTVGSMAAQMAQ